MDLQKFSTLAAQQVTMLGFELVYVETAQSGHDSVIRLYVDHIYSDSVCDRLLSIEDCVTINNALVAWMDVEFPVLREDFVIEVSSPGLERPLVSFEHFNRFRGHMCRVSTKLPIGGQKKFKGYIREITERLVTLESDGVFKEIPLDVIRKACLAPFDEEKNVATPVGS